jgi:hypothetical protein
MLRVEDRVEPPRDRSFVGSPLQTWQANAEKEAYQC